MSLVASFAPSLCSDANDATRATNKLHVYALQNSCDCPIMSQLREVNPSLLVWSIVTSPLVSVMFSWPITGYTPYYPRIFTVQVAQQLVGSHSSSYTMYSTCMMRGTTSQVSHLHKNAVHKEPMNRP